MYEITAKTYDGGIFRRYMANNTHANDIIKGFLRCADITFVEVVCAETGEILLTVRDGKIEWVSLNT